MKSKKRTTLKASKLIFRGGLKKQEAFCPQVARCLGRQDFPSFKIGYFFMCLLAFLFLSCVGPIRQSSWKRNWYIGSWLGTTEAWSPVCSPGPPASCAHLHVVIPAKVQFIAWSSVCSLGSPASCAHLHVSISTKRTIYVPDLFLLFVPDHFLLFSCTFNVFKRADFRMILFLQIKR